MRHRGMSLIRGISKFKQEKKDFIWGSDVVLGFPFDMSYYMIILWVCQGTFWIFFDFFFKFLEHLPKCTYIRHSNYSITSPPLPLNPNIILLIKPLSIRVYTINGYILTPTYIRCRWFNIANLPNKKVAHFWVYCPKVPLYQQAKYYFYTILRHFSPSYPHLWTVIHIKNVDNCS